MPLPIDYGHDFAGIFFDSINLDKLSLGNRCSLALANVFTSAETCDIVRFFTRSKLNKWKYLGIEREMLRMATHMHLVGLLSPHPYSFEAYHD
jgi:hypothetical protein